MKPSNNLENKTPLLKSSASMSGSSGSQFFRATTGIQSRLEAFDESRFVDIFLPFLGVAEILCSFRLVDAVFDYGKTGKEIPESSRLELLEKFLANFIKFSKIESLWDLWSFKWLV